MAGGETKDTIPTVLEIAASHPEVDAVVFLGMGIQGNQGRMEREGPFFPDHGLERIVGYHERQDHRFTTVAAELADSLGKPILTATELAVCRPRQPRRPRAAATPACSATPAPTAPSPRSSHLWRYARWRHRRVASSAASMPRSP